MLLMICVCLALFLTLPVVTAFLETRRGGDAPLQLEFWTFARSIGARCHVPLGRAQTPFVIKHTPFGVIRLSARRNLFKRWHIEVRAYLDHGFGFAGRFCCPPQEPLRWRTPGMGSVRLYHDEEEYLSQYSIESSDESLARWLLRHPNVRSRLSTCLEEAGADAIEFVLGNRVISVRMDCPRGWTAGDCVEHGGAAIVTAINEISSRLKELHEVMSDTETEAATRSCDACAQRLGSDPYRCKGCGVLVHRGCREMIRGCHLASCIESPDYIPSTENQDFPEAAQHA